MPIHEACSWSVFIFPPQSERETKANKHLFSAPPEIRLEIYDYLLIASLSLQRGGDWEENPSQDVPIEIDTTWHDGEDRMTIAARKRSGSNGEVHESLGLTPQLLSTCKAIHHEAAPILYSANLSEFRLEDERDLTNAVLSGGYRISSLCWELYQYPARCWRHGTCGVLYHSRFAMFLRQVGQGYAANLKRLTFFDLVPLHSWHSWHSWPEMHRQEDWLPIKVVAQLLKYHVPGVRQIQICRRCVDIDTFDYGSQESIACALESDTISPKVHVSYRDYNDRILFTNSHQEEQSFMCKSLEGLVQEITWLQQLSHKKMEELQALVEARR